MEDGGPPAESDAGEGALAEANLWDGGAGLGADEERAEEDLDVGAVAYDEDVVAAVGLGEESIEVFEGGLGGEGF